MIYQNNIFKIIKAPLSTEKASKILEKNNTFIIKVTKKAKKIEIKDSIQKLFTVKIKSINTLIVKGKKKIYKKKIGRSSDWKKAYVTLQKGQNLDLFRKSSD